MSKTYTATGINLKSIPFGENDRLLTILTPDVGMIRAVAPGARKHKSSLRGRSGLFVVNDLLIVRGRSLDRVIQAESVISFSNLSQDLGKLTAGQYVAELVLFQALSHHPQEELYALVCHYLARLESEPSSVTLPSLVQAIYALLAYGGIAPQVFRCCATQRAVQPNFDDPHWRVEFDATAGGIVTAVPHTPGSSDAAGETEANSSDMDSSGIASSGIDWNSVNDDRSFQEDTYASQASVVTDERDYRAIVRSPASAYNSAGSTDTQPYQNGFKQNLSQNLPHVPGINRSSSRKIELIMQLNALELAVLQWIAHLDRQHEAAQSPGEQKTGEPSSFEQISGDRPVSSQTWLSLERILRRYAQYHFDQSIQSAALIETCFLMMPPKH